MPTFFAAARFRVGGAPRAISDLVVRRLASPRPPRQCGGARRRFVRRWSRRGSVPRPRRTPRTCSVAADPRRYAWTASATSPSRRSSIRTPPPTRSRDIPARRPAFAISSPRGPPPLARVPTRSPSPSGARATPSRRLSAREDAISPSLATPSGPRPTSTPRKRSSSSRRNDSSSSRTNAASPRAHPCPSVRRAPRRPPSRAEASPRAYRRTPTPSSRTSPGKDTSREGTERRGRGAEEMPCDTNEWRARERGPETPTRRRTDAEPTRRTTTTTTETKTETKSRATFQSARNLREPPRPRVGGRAPRVTLGSPTIGSSTIDAVAAAAHYTLTLHPNRRRRCTACTFRTPTFPNERLRRPRFGSCEANRPPSPPRAKPRVRYETSPGRGVETWTWTRARTAKARTGSTTPESSRMRLDWCLRRYPKGR